LVVHRYYAFYQYWTPNFLQARRPLFSTILGSSEFCW